MIIKSISHTGKKHSIHTLIDYIWGADKNLKDTNGKTLNVKKNVRGDRSQWAEQFYHLEKRRTSFYAGREVKLYHEVLSFSPKSAPYLTREILKDLMKKYIELRTGNKVLACATVHFDQPEPIHCHIALSGINLKGESIRMSKADFKLKVQDQMEQYMLEKYPELSDSFIDYTKTSKTKGKSHQEEQFKKRTQELTNKEKLAQRIQDIYIHSNSLKTFENELQKAGIETYYRYGKLTGVYYGKKKWRLARTLGVDFSVLLQPSRKNERLKRIKELRDKININSEREI